MGAAQNLARHAVFTMSVAYLSQQNFLKGSRMAQPVLKNCLSNLLLTFSAFWLFGCAPKGDAAELFPVDESEQATGDTAQQQHTDLAFQIDPAKRPSNQALARTFRGKAEMKMAPPSILSALTDRTWKVNQIIGRSVPENIGAEMTFLANGRLRGSTGCNGFVTTYLYDGEQFWIGHITSSSWACTGTAASVEQGFLEALEAANRLHVGRGGSLILSVSGKEILVAD